MVSSLSPLSSRDPVNFFDFRQKRSLSKERRVVKEKVRFEHHMQGKPTH